MIKDAANKAMGADDSQKEFLFPDYGVTVKASSQEEAEKKLQEIIKDKNVKEHE